MMENLYLPGTVVFARVNPGLKLVVRRFAKRVYYCTVQENPAQKELVYFEREISNNPAGLSQ
ncbi:hypothetical protein [Rufibacter hautae]|uniref:Uncharacterized protein n=1 Tax=Rufibacter hautae TaxID=2595005 RepID=A0A5B6TJY1_9BACT|nr:hypothetical protein [Rufibacter hautae]KAA3439709.1 hypothetical protein FOA19_03245 [Rufibacter hautae]